MLKSVKIDVFFLKSVKISMELHFDVESTFREIRVFFFVNNNFFLYLCNLKLKR